MKLFVRDNRSICPECSGFVTVKQNYYKCVDCKKVYIGVDCGKIDGEVIVKELEGGRNE